VDYITIQELSRRTRIPERTLRRYIDRHKQFFTMRREGGVNFVTPEAAACAVKIRAGYDDGMTAAMAEALHKLSQAVAVPMAEMAEQQAAILDALAAMAGELQEERARSEALGGSLEAAREELNAIWREVAAMREPGGRGKDKGQARTQAEIMRELRATREALEAAETRQKRQDRRIDEIAEYVRPKPAEPEKRRRWWPWGR
jgi:DNA-binding transcriptional MerR regulator